MLRIIAGIIVGFVIMAIGVAAVFAITMLAIGGSAIFSNNPGEAMDRLLQPGTYWTTNTFNIIVLVGGFIAAIIGGLVCKLISGKSIASLALAVIVLALGVLSGVQNMKRPDPPARSSDVKLTDLQTHGKEPNWFAFSKAIAGALGVVIGSSLVARKGKG